MSFARTLLTPLTALCALCATCFLLPQARAAELTVDLLSVAPDGGPVRVAVHDASGGFPRGKPLQGIEVDPTRPMALFRDLPPGRYAVVAYQDRNGNRELDRGLFGIPAEPYGFSRDARDDGGPPKFRDAALDVPETGLHTRLKLR